MGAVTAGGREGGTRAQGGSSASLVGDRRQLGQHSSHQDDSWPSLRPRCSHCSMDRGSRQTVCRVPGTHGPLSVSFTWWGCSVLGRAPGAGRCGSKATGIPRTPATATASPHVLDPVCLRTQNRDMILVDGAWLRPRSRVANHPSEAVKA